MPVLRFTRRTDFPKTASTHTRKTGAEFSNVVSGRLLVFIGPGTGAKEVDTNPFQPSRVYIAAKEVPSSITRMDLAVN